ncbi:MAG: hypothetical protein IJH32_03825 [Ruminococcus sp.]|nr:hypothetical protein [Ruminococcus sp.]
MHIEKEKLIYGKDMSFWIKRHYLNAVELSPYEQIFFDANKVYVPYYRSWMHNVPMLVSEERDFELKKLSTILYQCCCYYAIHYKDYLDKIPFDEKALEILSYVTDQPFHAGTYRPDYLICSDHSLRLCEITSRFFGNGYFLSFFTEYAAKVFAAESGIKQIKPYFEELLAYMAKLPQGKKRLVVLKSADKSDSIKLYVPFYQKLGMKALILKANEVENHLDQLEDAFVVSALNQKDLLSFSLKTLSTLAKLHIYNDFRSIFLLHDKRFFALFSDEQFLHKCLAKDDAEFLKQHTVTTYLPGFHTEIWEDARTHKDRYILKHHCLGKSESVYAGPLTSDEKWEQLFVSGDIQHMILQPFMEQKRFPTVWNSKVINDYVSGTILTVDDRYFGTGMFRSSSSPVINVIDARKIAQLTTNQIDQYPQAHIL